MKNLNENIRAIITLITLVFGFIYFTLAAFFFAVHDPQITIVVSTLVTGVFAYWLGSSIGSSKKQDTINELTKTSESIIGDRPKDRG